MPRASQIELLGYSGQFDYPEFLAEVRPLSPPAPRAHGEVPLRLCTAPRVHGDVPLPVLHFLRSARLQYAPYDLYSLDNIGRAVHMFPHMTGMVKLDQASRLYWGPRVSGAGLQNILWADPRTVEDVQECVNAMRYEGPESKYPGLHGVGMRRDVGFVLEGGSVAAVQGGDDGVCAIMIEKKQAVDNLEALLSVPGVDMVQFGPSDYSMSIGVTGQATHPKVKEAETKIIKTALRMNIQPRVEMSFADEDSIIQYQDMGVKHWCMGPDTVVMFDYFTKQGKIVNDLMGRDPPGPLGYGQTRPGVPLRSTYGGNTISSNDAAGVSFSGGSFTPPAGQKKGAKI